MHRRGLVPVLRGAPAAAIGCIATLHTAHTPLTRCRYVPFGEIGEVLPYLIRRAQENSDMLAGVGGELRMLSSELRRRLLTAPAGGGN